MKAAAYILLVTFIAFIAQTIKLTAVCTFSEKQDACTMCPMGSTAESCPLCAKSKPVKGNEKPVSKCMDCPLCATMLATQPTNIKHTVYYTASSYAECIKSNVTDYACPQWKPPNAA